VILGALTTAEHNHYKHLDLDYVKKEAARLTYVTEEALLGTIAKNNDGIRRIMMRRDAMISKSEGPEEAKA
jgi:hypothetical protein